MVQLVKVSLPGLSRAEQPGFEPLFRYQRSVISKLNPLTLYSRPIASLFILRVLGICIMALAYWPRTYLLYLEEQKIKKAYHFFKNIYLDVNYVFRLSLRQMCKRLHEEVGSI